MLIQIVFFIFMVLGVTALFVDMGIVELTQSQMQNAADAAALEGLRQRDAAAPDATEVTPTDCNPSAEDYPDLLRRCAASDLVAGLSGGPEVTFADDSRYDGLNNASVQPSQYIDSQTTTTNPTYSLRANPLQANAGNDPTGDMVSGTYQLSVMDYTEMDDYTRLDFSSELVTNPAVASTDPSFLVRLRRTNESGVDGVSAPGPKVPLLFGRVSAPMLGTHNTRVEGIPVRATAIANQQIALRIGSANPSLGLLGATSFSLNRSCWNSIPTGMATDPTVACLGTLPLFGSPEKTVGLAVVIGGTLNPTSGGFMPVFDPETLQVVGFGLVSVNAAGFITIMPSQIAPANATALVTGGYSIPSAGLLLQSERPLLAPALVR